FAVAAFGTRERRLGSLAVYRRRGASTFDRTAVDVLTGFAAQAGLVLVLAEGVTARQRIAVYQERERISRDLHDVIVQRLYAISARCEVQQRKLCNRLDGGASEGFVEIVGQVDRTIEDIRATARALWSAEPESTDNGRSLE